MGYDEIISDLVDYFTPDADAIERVVSETAEAYRDEYESIVNVDEDDFDRGVLDDFFDEVKREIAINLDICGLA